MNMSRILNGHSSIVLKCCAMNLLGCTEGALNPVLARRLVARKGEVGHRGGGRRIWVRAQKQERRSQGWREWEGGGGVNQPASLPFVVQMSPVTVKERAGLMIGGACFKL